MASIVTETGQNELLMVLSIYNLTFGFFNALNHLKMAKVLLGAGTTDMRNKVNGWVYSRNRYGNYVRTKVTPINPQTQHQQKARQQLGTLSSQWRGLTEAQRKGWIQASPSFPVTDVFGFPLQLAGNALFIALNRNLLKIAATKIEDAPVPVGIPDLFATSLTADSATPALSIAISEDTIPTGFQLAVYATPNIGPGIGFVKNRYRFIGTATAATGVVDILSIWQSRFGTMTSGQKIAVRIALVSSTTGQSGVPSATSAIIS